MSTTKAAYSLITINWTEGTNALSDEYEGKGVDAAGFARFVARQQAEIAKRDGYCFKCEVTVLLRSGDTATFRADIDREFTTLRAVVETRVRNYASVAETGKLPCGTDVPWMTREIALEHVEMFSSVLEALDAPEPAPAPTHTDWARDFLGL